VHAAAAAAQAQARSPACLQVLELHFNVISVKPGQTAEYKGYNLHVKIENTDCEVQLRGAFEHSFYQIQHKFGYKVKGEATPSPFFCRHYLVLSPLSRILQAPK
jgi:hypothetical protein